MGDMIGVDFDFIETETEIAVLVMFNEDDDELVWVPKSLIDNLSEIEDKIATGEGGEIMVPEWWATQECLI